MTQRILTYRGQGQRPADLKAYVEGHTKLKIIDSFGRTIIVEGAKAEIEQLLKEAPRWRASAVKSVAPPNVGAANVGRLRLPNPAQVRTTISE